jgi:hypothetical protein
MAWQNQNNPATRTSPFATLVVRKLPELTTTFPRLVVVRARDDWIASQASCGFDFSETGMCFGKTRLMLS